MSITEAFYEFIRYTQSRGDLTAEGDKLWRRVIIAAHRDIQPPTARQMKTWLTAEGMREDRALDREDEYERGIELLRMYDPPKYTFTGDIDE